MEILVARALRRFRPEMIVVASGLDANGFDPLARMQAHSDTFRALTAEVMTLADDMCGGRLLCVHEGGYAEAIVPFCGLAVVETLAGTRTGVTNPVLDLLCAQQPAADFAGFQRDRLQAQARLLGEAG